MRLDKSLELLTVVLRHLSPGTQAETSLVELIKCRRGQIANPDFIDEALEVWSRVAAGKQSTLDIQVTVAWIFVMHENPSTAPTMRSRVCTRYPWS